MFRSRLFGKRSTGPAPPQSEAGVPDIALTLPVRPVAQLAVDTLRKLQWRTEVDLALPGYEDQSLVLVARATMRYLLLIETHAMQRIRKTDLLDRFDSAVRSRLKLRCEGVFTGAMETLLLAQSKLQQTTPLETRFIEHRTGAHRNFNLLVETALDLGASDIHLEFRDDSQIRIQVRVHGKLRAIGGESTLFADYVAMLDAVTAAYNSRADMSSRSHNHFDEYQHQSCSVPILVKGRYYQLRFQSVKENRGLDVILRILLNEARDNDVMTLAALGYAPDQVATLEDAVH